MKHLKKFNELKSSTYKKVSNKLKEMGHPRRSGVMASWATEVEQREKDAKELETYNEWFKNGDVFEMDIVKQKWNATEKKYYNETTMSGRFVLNASLESDWAGDMFADNYSDNNFQYGFSLPFEIGIMPADEETKKEFREKENQFSDEIYDGVYWCTRVWVNLIKGGEGLVVNPSGQCSIDSRDNDLALFKNRKEAIRFKKLFVESIEGKNKFGSSRWYPHGLGEQVKKFLSEKPSSRIEQEEFDTLMEGAYEKFVNSVKKMSVNILYKN